MEGEHPEMLQEFIQQFVLQRHYLFFFISSQLKYDDTYFNYFISQTSSRLELAAHRLRTEAGGHEERHSLS